jgi:hypothetical protein
MTFALHPQVAKKGSRRKRKMQKLTVSAIVPVLVIFGASSLAFARVPSWDQPEAQSYKGVPYISGGVGSDERATLSTMAKKDNLELSFALQDKDYLGGAKVLIKDAKDHVVLQAASDGPLFYTRLPEGAYTVMATANGKTQIQKVRIPDKGKAMVFFAWKEANHQMASLRAGHDHETVAYRK